MDMESDHNHAYKFCMNYCLQVNNYKYVRMLNFKVMSEKFNVDRTCSSQKKILPLLQ